ncbi:MAG: hypothetical protein IVW55_10965 [Chloroflexi bacterium]|nr:hypothetical protein [Chloroflexota bacterium]
MNSPYAVTHGFERTVTPIQAWYMANLRKVSYELWITDYGAVSGREYFVVAYWGTTFPIHNS